MPFSPGAAVHQGEGTVLEYVSHRIALHGEEHRRDVRALAREWGSKKTYPGAGSWGVGVGGACRTATGMQWARMMTIHHLKAAGPVGKSSTQFELAEESRYLGVMTLTAG